MMRTQRALMLGPVVLMGLLTFVLRSTRPVVHAAEQPVTYSRQIAAILYANCTTCHHEGGAGPFSLMTYAEAKRHAVEIATVTQSRYMPPWLPEPGYGDFADNRRLSDHDREMLRVWVKAGMPEGDMAAPKAPVYPSEWELGPPDLVLSMDAPFVTPASGTDVFRNFILPYPLAEGHSIRAMEIRPGAAAVVHHANVLLDRTGSYRRQHPAEWKTGVPGMELVVDAGSTFDPDSHFLFWKPDSPVIVEPKGMEWHLDPGDDLILNMHLKPTGKAETIQAKVGLYFSRTAATEHPMLLQLEHDAALDIPAGDSHFVVNDELKLPIAVKVLGVYPHAHYLGKDLQAYAILPNGTKRWLVWIKDWDIDRQAVYRYREPILLPKGSVVHMHYVYDNSAANVRNPHVPPVRVRAGNRSEDEMGHLWLQVLPVEPTVEGRDSRLILEQAWMASRLRKDADDPMALYNLAASSAEEGKDAEAIALYRRVLVRSPKDARTLTALGAAQESSGDWQAAAASYKSALAANAGQNDARFDLAGLELKHEQYAEAKSVLRELLERTPRDAAAHSALGVALLNTNQGAAARGEFEQSLTLDAQDATALEELGQLDLEAGDFPRAIDSLTKAIAVRDSAETRERLAMAYAQSNRIGDAATQLRAAIGLKPGDAGSHALLSQVDESLGVLPDAIREQQTALKLAPGDADGWNNLGVLHARSGLNAEARKDFERALQLAPGHAQAQANLKRLGSGSQ